MRLLIVPLLALPATATAAPDCLYCRNLKSPAVTLDDVVWNGAPTTIFTALADGSPPDESLVYGIDFSPGGHGNGDSGDAIVDTLFQASTVGGTRSVYSCRANLPTQGAVSRSYVAFMPPYAGGFLQVRNASEADIVTVSGGPSSVTSTVQSVKGFSARIHEVGEQNSHVAIGYEENGVIKIARNGDVNPFFCGNDGFTTASVCSASAAIKIASATPDPVNTHQYQLDVRLVGGGGRATLSCNVESGCPATTVGNNLTVTCADVEGHGVP